MPNDPWAQLLDSLPHGSQCFLFGSSLDANATPADVDVLIVYRDDAVSEMIDFLDINEGVAAAYGFDLTILTRSEVDQVEFISLTGATPLTEMNTLPTATVKGRDRTLRMNRSGAHE